jgi:hypothetical protein
LSITEDGNSAPKNAVQPTASAMQIFLLLYNLVISCKWPITIIWCTWIAVPALAGRTTSATISVFVELITEIGEKQPTPWVGTAACFAWALAERQFRRRKTAYLAQRNQELELMMNPLRSSSNLAPHGDSRNGGPWKR